MKWTCSLLAPALAAALLGSAAPAAAHFLWIGVEAGPAPAAHLTFGETPDEATTAVPVSRLAGARGRDAAGKPLALTTGEGRWSAPVAGRPAVGAVESWGVVDRSGDGTGAFLLEYYAKAGAGVEDTAADLGLPLELFARREGNQIVATLSRAGGGVPNAPVKVHLPSGKTLDRTADGKGEVRFDAEGGGLYGLRGRFLEERKGESEGKAYGEVRHYSTLTFSLPEGAAAAAAGAASPRKADPAAYALLKAAHDSRQVMPPDFPGFRADLVFLEGDRSFQGEMIYRRQGETEVRLAGVDEASLAWVRGQILNLVGHRRGGDFAQGDGRYPLELGPDDGNPFGRLVRLHDATDSSYRVRDNRVTEVTRTMQGSRFTISVIETIDADDGKYLANHFMVSYRDAKTGVLQKVEGYRDGYAKVGGVWLPTGRIVIDIADETTPVVRSLKLRKVEHLAAAAATKTK